MTNDTLIELLLGQLQRLLLRHAGDRKTIGLLEKVFQSIQQEKYAEALQPLDKIQLNRKLDDSQRLDFARTVMLVELLDQGLDKRQMLPATEELLNGPRAEVAEIAPLIEKLCKQPRIDYWLRATAFRRASFGTRVLLTVLALLPLGVAGVILKEGSRGVGTYVAAAAFVAGGLYLLGVAMVGEKKSVEKVVDQALNGL